jgi:hypothetical protein
MSTNKRKSRIIKITSWTFSILGLIIGLLFLIGNLFGSIIAIFSALLIFPPTRKLYEKKVKLRYRFTYVLSFVLFFIGSMIVGLTVEVDAEALAESITRETPSESVQESLSPEVSFKYSCGFADDIYVNGEELSREDRKKLCDEGLSLTLSDGENSYELLFKTGDSEYKESVVIKFDSAAYELRLQEQEEEEQTPIQEVVEETDKTTTGERNALRSALDYLDYSAFSYSGLIEQLEYEGYSNEEAVYAVDNCGADWNEQAALSAQSYIDYSAFSRTGLIEQLEYEGFTREQAEYGVAAVGY